MKADITLDNAGLQSEFDDADNGFDLQRCHTIGSQDRDINLKIGSGMVSQPQQRIFRPAQTTMKVWTSNCRESALPLGLPAVSRPARNPKSGPTGLSQVWSLAQSESPVPSLGKTT